LAKPDFINGGYVSYEARVFAITTLNSPDGKLIYYLRLVSYDILPQIEKVEEKPQKVVVQLNYAQPSMPAGPTNSFETKMDLFFSDEEWLMLKDTLIIGDKIKIDITPDGIKFSK